MAWAIYWRPPMGFPSKQISGQTMGEPPAETHAGFLPSSPADKLNLRLGTRAVVGFIPNA